MLGSAIIEVAIGLVFVYVLLSLLCSAVNELIAQLTGTRARTLQKGISRLITDRTVREGFFNHPIIKCLGKDRGKKGVRPSYIPSRMFALALLDTVAPAREERPASPAIDDPKKEQEAADLRAFNSLRDSVSVIQLKDLREALVPLVESAKGSYQRAVENVEAWFDSAMDRISGWYRRRTQWVLLFLAIGVAAALNVDTIELATRLWREPAWRQTLVTAAERYADSAEDAATVENRTAALQDLRSEIDLRGGPFGWSRYPTDPIQWIWKVVGILLTALAVSLGAPFWFDLLGKVAKLRSTGKVPGRSAQTG